MEKKLVYNVLREGNKSIELYNIFDHMYLSIEELNRLKFESLDKEAFAARLKSRLRYCFWCKSECELFISDIHEAWRKKRIDIYDQLMLNYPLLVDYVWSNL